MNCGTIASSDGKNLSLDLLLKWWEDSNRDSGSRLILMLDTQYSHRWAHDIGKARAVFVAVQTCR